MKESVDLSFRFLVDNIQGDVERLQIKQQQLNSHWQELQTLVSDRFDELVAMEWELEKANMTASINELNDCVETAKGLLRVEVPRIGSSSLEEIKSLVARYQVNFCCDNCLRSSSKYLQNKLRNINGRILLTYFWSKIYHVRHIKN